MRLCTVCGDEIDRYTKSGLCRSCSAYRRHMRQYETNKATERRRRWYAQAMLNRWPIKEIAAAARENRLRELALSCPVNGVEPPFLPYLPCEDKPNPSLISAPPAHYMNDTHTGG